MTSCAQELNTANAPPTIYEMEFLPRILMTKSRIKACEKIPIMGPKIKALGEIDFIIAQISPALHISPLIFHTWKKETTRYTVIKDSIEPAIGTLRLCNKLPSIISMVAHKLPTTAAFIHFSDRGLFKYSFIQPDKDK